MVNGIRTIWPSSKFLVGTPVRQETREEGRRTHWPKHCEYTNKDEDISPNSLREIILEFCLRFFILLRFLLLVQLDSLVIPGFFCLFFFGGGDFVFDFCYVFFAFVLFYVFYFVLFFVFCFVFCCFFYFMFDTIVMFTTVMSFFYLYFFYFIFFANIFKI